jgi:Tol biopolymer transport system component
MSPDARFVTSLSWASDLVPNDSNGYADTFLTDRRTGTAELVSVTSQGLQGNGDARLSSVTPDGRYVVFDSAASNLAPPDTNGSYDVFVRDRSAHTTTLASVSTAGVAANGDSTLGLWSPDHISADGRYVVFESDARDLTLNPPHKSEISEVYLRDLVNDTTTMVSVNSKGVRAHDWASAGAISADGRFVVFSSSATNLADGLSGGVDELFLHDMATGKTRLISAAPDGTPGDFSSYGASFSGDDRYVVFQSSATNLAAGGSNGDVWMLDRRTWQLTRVSVSSTGGLGNYPSDGGIISADGHYVVFSSNASNLVPDDTNYSVDVFLRDLRAGTTTLQSVSTAGAHGEGGYPDSAACGISSDGRYILFNSDATNMVKNDTNDFTDIFMRGPLH